MFFPSEKIYFRVKKSVSLSNDEKSKQNLPTSQQLEERKTIQNLMVEYLLKRISVVSINDTEAEIKLVALCDDMVDDFDLSIDRPDGLQDVDMKRKGYACMRIDSYIFMYEYL